MEIVRKVLGPIQTNVYYVFDKETKECVIIDPADEAGRIVAYIDKEGLKPTHILLTHGHFDHISAADEIRDHYHIPVWALDKEKETLLDPVLNGDARFLRKNLQVRPDRFFTDGEKFTLLGAEWEVIWTPGHTAGSCCFYVPSEGILFSGDTLFQQSIGRFDMPGGCFEDICHSVREKLFKLPDRTVVFPGHMEETTIGFERRYNPLAV